MAGTGIETLLAWKAVAIAVALLTFGAWERLRPMAGSPLVLRLGSGVAAVRRTARNLALFALNFLLSPAIVLPLTAWASSLDLTPRPAFLSGPAFLLVDVLLLDLWIYWWHRANHELQWLWRFHQVHHLDETLDVTSAVRFHAGEVVLSALVRAAVIVVLGISLPAVLLFEALVLVAAIFHHSDSRLPPALERGLSGLVVTPSLHWVHHHAIRADTDSNYGTIFSFWDRLFGSRSPTERWPAMPIGVEGLRDREVERLLILPFAAAPVGEPPRERA